jgi:hypothetical protein
MSSYKPLADYLARRKGDQWDASFDDVERALGRPLPQSAYRYNAWWANQTGPGHSQTQGWRSVGWRTSKLDLERKRVRFERERAISDAPGDGATGEPDGVDEVLVRRAMVISNIEDRSAVINAALQEFIRQGLVRFVEELGGSQPDFEAAPRERPWA